MKKFLKNIAMILAILITLLCCSWDNTVSSEGMKNEIVCSEMFTTDIQPIIDTETTTEETTTTTQTIATTTTTQTIATTTTVETIIYPSSGHLTKRGGVFSGPSGIEKYYNLNMTRCISFMQENLNYDWTDRIREDGVKMFGDYIMCAMNTNIYPKGTIVETSLGTAIVVDHCVAAEWKTADGCDVDIAVSW